MAERGLRLLVRCYPPSIRETFGRDIAMTFRDAYVDRVRGPFSFLSFWALSLWEGMVTISAAWWERWTGRRSRYALGGKRPGSGNQGPRRNRGWGDALAHELRFAVRGVFRRPMFAGAVVGTLALGIAGVTTLAAVVWGVLLAPLPYANADRLVRIWWNQEVVAGVVAGPGGFRRYPLSPRQVEAFRHARTIEELTFIEGPRTATLIRDGIAEEVDVTYTAGNLLSFLGAGVALGRLYGPSDEAGDEPVVVLAHGTWVRRYGGDPGVLGTHVSLGGQDYRVIGVLESGFRYVLAPNAVEYWIPRALQTNRAASFYTGLARMGPNVTPDDVSRELGPMVIRLYEERYGEYGLEPQIGPEDAATVRYVQEELLEYARGRVWLLFGAGAIVLLLACANVASLLLVSASERSHELVLRGAIGAGRGRLAVHLLSEAVVLSFLGGAFGAALTPMAMRLLKMGAPEGIPRLESVTVGWPMLAAGLLVTTATVLLIGTPPAWAHSRPPLGRGLNVGATGSPGTPTASRLRGGLLVAQVCGAFVMLLGTGLMIRSYRELATEDLGFRTDGILYGQVRLPTNLWESLGEMEYWGASVSVVRGSPELAEVRRVLKQRLAAHPAAGRVTLAKGAPLAGGYGGAMMFTPEGWDGVVAEGEDRRFASNAVDPSFFHLLGVRLLRGRFLRDEDGREGAASVAVISDALANRFWPGEDPLGKRFGETAMALTDGAWNEEVIMTEVVGVVASLREWELRLPGRTVYTPLNRAYDATIVNYRGPTLSFFIESEDPASVAEHARAVLADVLPGTPLRHFGSLDDVTARWLREPRFYAYLIGFFGTYAVLLAGLGIAASVAAVVSQRRWEIGVRVALGASVPAVLRVVVGHATVLTVVGLLLGLGVGLFSARLLDSLLYGVGPLDPATYLLTAVTLLGVAVTAASLPVIRGLRLDPAEALKAE